MVKKYLLALILIVFLGCQQEKIDWNPTFEETNFDYFQSSIARSLSSLSEATDKTDEQAVQDALSKVKKNLLELKDYYVPLTSVRQKIYDAERYFKLTDIKKAEKLLTDSKSIITSLEVTTQNKVFDKVILDLNSKIDEVIFSFDGDSELTVSRKLKVLGEHINLMLSRGDLVLSGIEFDN